MGSVRGVMQVAAQKLGLSLAAYESRVASGMKWCTKGKHWVPRLLFTVDTSRGDGLKATCSACGYARKGRVEELVTPSTEVRQSASSKVSYAVKRGLLPNIKTCTCKCGAPAVHYHHHLGYSEEHWLDVEALCRSCHKKAHHNQGE
jgi:hypothetical protein